MIEFSSIKSVIDQYAKHGWKLRRVMLTSSSLSALRTNLAQLSADAEIIEAANEGLWFSRPTPPDREAWELRRLSGSPFALVAVIEDSLSADEREDVLGSVERRMFDGSHPEPTSH